MKRFWVYLDNDHVVEVEARTTASASSKALKGYKPQPAVIKVKQK